jgi:hypothetical protein
MDAVKEIRATWVEWKTSPFPADYAGKDVADICVTSLDSYAAGCIDTFIARNGRLDGRRIAVLEECRKELEVVVKNLSGEARTYFNNLLLISERVLQLVGQ